MHEAPLACLMAANTRLMALTPTDPIIVLLYFGLVLGLGVYLRRFASTSNDFFMAGREITTWIAGLSFIPENLGSLEMMGYAAAARSPWRVCIYKFGGELDC